MFRSHIPRQSAIITVLLALAVGCTQTGAPEPTSVSAIAPPVVPSLSEIDIDPATVDRIDAAVQAVRSDPTSAQAWLELGMVYHAHGFHAQASTSYEQAAAYLPDQARPHYLLAMARSADGDVAGAIEAAERAVALSPAEPAFRWRLGYLYLDAGQPEAAREAFEHALEFDPDSEPALIGLGRVALQQDRPADAVERLQAAAEVTTANHGAIDHLLVRAYRRLGDDSRAERALATASEGAPVFEDQWLAQVGQMQASSIAGIRAAQRMLEEGRIQEAIDVLEILSDRDASDFRVHETLGVAYGRLGRLDESSEAFRTVIEIEPEHANGYENLARALMKQWDALPPSTSSAEPAPDHALLDRALDHVDRAIDLQPQKTSAVALRGDLLRRKEEYAAAGAAYEAALALNPSEVLYAQAAASAYLRAEAWGQAIPMLEVLSQRSPGDSDVWLRLAQSRLRVGQLDAAETALIEAERLAPYEADVAATREQLDAARGGGS